MKQHIESLIRQAVRQLSERELFVVPDTLPLSIERPRDPSHGDFSSNIAMVLAKVVGISPRTLAQQLIDIIPLHGAIGRIELAGPGFINFTLSDAYVQTAFERMCQSPSRGVEPLTEQKTIVIDYSSPNLAKEMHVGHLRSTIIGDAIARIMALKGYNVIRQNHVGDWGTQFGMLIAHLNDEEHSHPGDVPLNDLECFYKMAKQRFDSDPLFAERARHWVVLLQSGDAHCIGLWKMFITLSLEHCQAIYDRLGVSLQPTDVMAESAYNHHLPNIIVQLRQQGLLVEHQGAQCVFLDEFKGKENEPLPIIVQKKDGGFLYASTDLAAVTYRQSVLHADRCLYVVDARQSLHFQQIFALAYKAGFVSASLALEHVSFGMVLDKSGKPYKSRDGGVTKLVDLLDEAERRAKALVLSKNSDTMSPEEQDNIARVLGISAVKYSDLSKNRTSDYVFDWDTMLSFEGNTAPYLLYAYTRIQSIFRKASVTPESLDAPLLLTDPLDRTLAKKLLLYPEVIDTVVLKAMPHFLCTYLYELAGLFSSFYETCPILNQKNLALRASRLQLVGLTAHILHDGLSLLGITTLDQM
jgi:arginyl-tRNA synthetase